MRVWCGIDWSHSWHEAALVDAGGAVVGRCRLKSDPAGIHTLLTAIRSVSRTPRADVLVGIEDVSGALAHALIAAGFDVRLVHPVASADFRRRRAGAGGKSDAADAVVLAEMMRLEPEAHRPAPRDSALALAIRSAARSQTDLVLLRRTHAGRLRQLLLEVHPAAAAALGPLSTVQAMVALRAAPTPSAARSLRAASLALRLRQAGVAKPEEKASALVERLRAPVLVSPAAVEAVGRQSVLAMLTILETVTQETAAAERQVVELFRSHPQHVIFSSFPGLGGLLGARLLAEMGDDPGRFPNSAALRAFAGTAPVTRSSGMSSTTSYRRVCNKRARHALHLWVLPLAAASEVARERYRRRRAAGDRHSAACRDVADLYLSVLHRCLRSGSPYSEIRLAMAIATRSRPTASGPSSPGRPAE